MSDWQRGVKKIFSTSLSYFKVESIKIFSILGDFEIIVKLYLSLYHQLCNPNNSKF